MFCPRFTITLAALLTAGLTLPLLAKAQSHATVDTVINQALIASPWPTYRGTVSRDSSTPLRGPTHREPNVQISYFADATGTKLGRAPGHVLSDNRYDDGPRARTIWGASQNFLYKYQINGHRFAYADSFRLNDLEFIGDTDLLALADGRIITPSPNGLRVAEHQGADCAGRFPSLLVFRDGATVDSPIACVAKFEFSPTVLEDACGFDSLMPSTRNLMVDTLLDGHVAVRLRRNRVDHGLREGFETWVAILNNELTRIRACAKVADGLADTGLAMEPMADGSTLFYTAMETDLVAMRYRAVGNKLERLAAVPITAEGRTTTTPTLLTDGPFGWVITVDSRCEVDRVFTGQINCDPRSDHPSAMVAVPRPVGMGPTAILPLPGFIDTVEGSPAIAGRDIVISNYNGESPEPRRDTNGDGLLNRVTGIVKLSWNPTSQRFQIDWTNPDIQFSGVPTISRASNMVYGSGVEDDGLTYFYGLRLRTDGSGPAGAMLVRVALGPAVDSYPRAGDAIYDASSNIVINDDGSAIVAGGQSLIRIQDR
ncbi:MAG: hypothetical protein AAF213_07250 [Pseudomonadota bacterium]